MGTNPPASPPGRSSVPATNSGNESPAPSKLLPDAALTAARPQVRARMRAMLAIIRGKPTGRLILKIVIGVIGGVVVAIGIALIPLPGPGWALVLLGLAVWAIEFVWAKRLLHFTRRNVRKWTRWVGRQSLLVRLALGALGLCFVAVVGWASLKLGLGIDLLAQARSLLATR